MKTIDRASDSAHDVVDKITDVTNQAADAIGATGQQLKNAEQGLMKDCCNYIKENPMTSIGIAVASGFLLSRILSGR